jgi:hypothetical protein
MICVPSPYCSTRPSAFECSKVRKWVPSPGRSTQTFARMARGEIVGPEVETTRRQLLRYCERDTLAMVRLHERLIELASGQVVLERASS